MSLTNYLLQGYWDEYGDSRVPRTFINASLGPLLLLLTIWSLFVLYLGPRFMVSRPAFSLKPLLVVYNLCLSLWNLYFFYRFTTLHNYGSDVFQMDRPSFEDTSPQALEQIDLQQLYLLSKLVDLFETVAYILRKKNTQVSGLHFYHHLTVPLIVWSHYRLVGNGRTMLFVALFNTTIHTIMYAYYGLSALGPHMQPYLWWKKYITQLQIIQFLCILTYGLVFTLYNRGYPAYFSHCLNFHALLYIYLFTSFYLKTYQKKGTGKANESVDQGSTSNGKLLANHQDEVSNGRVKDL